MPLIGRATLFAWFFALCDCYNFRYAGDPDRGPALMKLLKRATFLDPRLIQKDDADAPTRDDLIYEAVLLGM